jgi:hypothetical protein
MKKHQINDWLEDNLQNPHRSMPLDNGDRLVYLSDVKKLVAGEFAEPEPEPENKEYVACESCGCHPKVIYNTTYGRFCTNCVNTNRLKSSFE